MPCWHPPTNENIDKQKMARLFESTLRGQDSDATHCTEIKHCDIRTTTISSHAMQQALRMYGLFDFISPSSDPVINCLRGAKPLLWMVLHAQVKGKNSYNEHIHASFIHNTVKHNACDKQWRTHIPRCIYLVLGASVSLNQTALFIWVPNRCKDGVWT